MRHRNIRHRDRSRSIQNVQSIISLLDNSDEFKGRLNEMGVLSAELDAKIAAWGKIEDIDNALKEALEARQTAERSVSDSREAATKLLADADVAIKEGRRALTKRVKGQTKREAEVALGMKELGRRESAIQLDLTTIAAREARCIKREQAAAEAKLVAEQTLERIKEAALG